MNTLRAIAAPAQPSLPGRLRRALLGISTEATRPARRGFRVTDAAVEARLARIGETFLAGYHAALAEPRPEPLASRLDREFPIGWRGFAYEGAGMGVALVDWLAAAGRSTPRLAQLLAGPGHPHRYLVAVGAGWTLARLPRRTAPLLAALPPHLRWLALDGYGFHHGYFAWPRAVERRRLPRRATALPYARRAFDQGLGRSLWFVAGTDPERIARRIGAFAPQRRADLWSGVGLAAAYAGGLGPDGVARLRTLAGEYAPELAQGAAFAAKARHDASDAPPHLDSVCRVLCGRDAAAAAALTERRERQLDLGAAEPLDLPVPLYEAWRRSVRDALAAEEIP